MELEILRGEMAGVAGEELASQFLDYVSQNCSVDVVLLFLELGVDVNHRHTRKGNTALLLACVNSHLQVVDCLLEQGADPNVPGQHGLSPLSYAALFGNAEITASLIAAGANVEHLCEDDNSILYYAIKRSATQPENSLVVQQLIAAGVDIHAKRGANAPLFDACSISSIEVAKLLVAGGADIDQAGFGQKTPLTLSAEKNAELCVFLVLKGANVNHQDKFLRTPLFCAVGAGAKESVQQLIAAGADVNPECEMPLMHWAVKKCAEDIIPLLIAAGTNIDAMDKDGENATRYFTATTPEAIRLALASLQ